jgi:phosphate transport system permease protein
VSADRVLHALLRAAGWLVAAVPVFVALFLLRAAWPALTSVGLLPFVTGSHWAPTSGSFGLLPMVAGTLVSSGLAVALAAPLGVAYGLHVNLFAPRWFAAASRAVVAMLAGVPSVVFGLVALLEIVPLVRAYRPPGLSLLVAALVLAVMVMPTVAATTEAAVRQVDPLAVAAARSLGLGRWDTARGVILPLAAPAIRTGVLLALGRALGETMAVLMVAGNTVAWPSDLFLPFRTLTGNVAVEMAYATGVHRAGLFVTGLVLLGLVAALVALDMRERASR